MFLNYTSNVSIVHPGINTILNADFITEIKTEGSRK